MLQSSLYTWRLVFLITAGAYAGSALIFACLVPATVQEWNFPKKPKCDLVKVEPSGAKIWEAKVQDI